MVGALSEPVCEGGAEPLEDDLGGYGVMAATAAAPEPGSVRDCDGRFANVVTRILSLR